MWNEQEHARHALVGGKQAPLKVRFSPLAHFEFRMHLRQFLVLRGMGKTADVRNTTLTGMCVCAQLSDEAQLSQAG